MANGVITNPNKAITLTPTVSKTSGASSVSSVTATRNGNVVFLKILFALGNSSVNVGSNTFAGTISNIALPVNTCVGCGYYGSTAFFSAIESTGAISVRVIGATKPASTTDTFGISWTYITP